MKTNIARFGIALRTYGIQLAVLLMLCLCSYSQAQSGSAHGGQQPIAGAHLYMFAVSTTGGSPTSLLSGAGVTVDSAGNGYVTTDGGGNFNISGLYAANCPTPDPWVYLMLVGGDPGVGVNNPDIVLVSALPVTCSNVPNAPFVAVNELTTVAAARALSAYATVSTDSFSGTSAPSIASAFAYANDLVSGFYGIVQTTTPAGDGIIPYAQINTIADILAGCVNSDGTTPCTALFSATTPPGGTAPADTLQAALDIALNPGLNIFGLLPPSGSQAFSPVLPAAPVTWSIAITPVITWPAPSAITYGTALSATQLNATTTMLGSFYYGPVSGTIPGAGTQTLSVTFVPNDITDYTSFMATTTIVVNKATPVITWPTPAAITYPTPFGPTQQDATANVLGSFKYSPNNGYLEDAGPNKTLSVTFTPNDITDYNTATASVLITINKGTPIVTWAPAPLTYGQGLTSAQLDAQYTTVPGAFTYFETLGQIYDGGTHTLSASFLPTNHSDYNELTNVTATLTVNLAPAPVTWPTPAAITYGTPLSSAQLDATVGFDGNYAYLPPAGTVLGAGTQTLSVTFTPTEHTTDYATGAATTTLVVNKATPVITWPAPAAITYGTPLSAAQQTATYSVPGSLTYLQPIGTILSAGTQTLSATFVPTDQADYNSVTVTTTIVVGKVIPVITWPTPAAITYPTPLSSTQLNATLSVPGTPTYTQVSGTVLNAGTQTLSVTFVPTDSTDYATVTGTTTLVVNKATPVITWATPASITYPTPFSAAQLDATANVPGTYKYSVDIGQLEDAGANKSLNVVFTPTDITDYNTATASVLITINKGTPTATWNPPPLVYGQGFSLAQENAVGSVPGAFTYFETLGNIYTAGTHTLSASFLPTNNSDYIELTNVNATLTVSMATPTLTWPAPAAITYGTPLTAIQLNATANITGVFSYTPVAGTVPGAGTQTLSVTFTPTEHTADYTTATATTTLVVNKATPTITWPAPAAITYGTPLSAIQQNATQSVPGALTYLQPLGTVLSVGTHTLSVTLVPTDQADYNSVTVTTTIVVGKATPVVTWPAPAAITYGTALSATQQNATFSVPGAPSYVQPIGTVLNAGTQTLSVTFVPTDSTDYSTVTGTTTLIVNKATPVITWATPAPITYPTPFGPTQQNATANVPGTPKYSPSPGYLEDAGPNKTLTVTFTPTDTTDYNTATASVLITINKGTPVVTWAPAPLTYGQGLTPAQLDAQYTTVPGSFNYFENLGQTYTAGTHTLSASFLPTNNSDYIELTNVTATLTVNIATPTITWPAPAAITFGTPLTATQLDASANITGTYTYLPPMGTVLGAGPQTLSVTFAPTEHTADYAPSTTVTTTLVVNKATPTINWPAPAAISFGTPLSSAQLDATLNVPAAPPVYTPGSGTVLNAGTQALSVLFTPTDQADYLDVTGTTTLVVNNTPIATAMTVAATPNPVAIGWPVLVQVLVTGTGGVVPSGSVTCTSGTLSGSHALAADGTAKIVLSSFTSVGQSSIACAFTGAGFINSNGTASVTVTAIPSGGIFTDAGITSTSLMPGRVYGTATLLNDGTILLAGGTTSMLYLNRDVAYAVALIYNPQTNTLSIPTGTQPNLNTPRMYAAATLLPNGKVLIVGGMDVSENVLSSAELYDPVQQTFTLVNGSMTVPRAFQAATLLNTGKVLISGGVNNNQGYLSSAELYDPNATSNPFQSTGSASTFRYLGTTTLLADGNVLMTGGFPAGGVNNPPPMSSAEIYNTSQGTFSTVGSMLHARYAHTANLLANGQVLITSGAWDGSAQSELYDPSTGTFSAGPNANTPRYGPIGTTLLNGMVLIAGGGDGNGNPAWQAELYSPLANSFSYTGSFVNQTQAAPEQGTLMPNGSVVFTSGVNVQDNTTGDIQTYNLPMDTGSLDIKYQILTVLYAPPGSKSSAVYSANTTVGSTTSTENIFNSQSGFSVTAKTAGGIFGSGGSISGTASTQFTYIEDNTASYAVTTTDANSLTVQAVSPYTDSLGIDHDYDQILVWLNPMADYTFASPQDVLWNGYSYNTNDTNVNGKFDYIALPVWELKHLIAGIVDDPLVAAALARTWDPVNGGLTTQDLQSILAADPFAVNPLYDPYLPDPTTGAPRYDSRDSSNWFYTPGVNQSETETYQQTSTLGQSSSNAYQVGVSVDADFTAGFAADIFSDTAASLSGSVDVKVSNTETWTNKWTKSSSTMTQQGSLITIDGPASAGLSVPQQIIVWQDNVYGTFMFTYGDLPSVTSVTLSPTTSSFNTPVTATVNVTSTSGVPSGTVSCSGPGLAASPSVTINSSGLATMQLTGLALSIGSPDEVNCTFTGSISGVTNGNSTSNGTAPEIVN